MICETEAELLAGLRASIAATKAPEPMPVRRIGSTDIAAIAAFMDPALAVDLPKNKTAGDVWLRLCHGIDLPRSKQMARGNDVEPALLECYRENIGPAWRPTLEPGRWWTVRHPRHDFATCSPDAFDAETPTLLVELKSQSVWARNQWGTPGTDEVATRYLYQAAWAMACCGVEECRFLVGFGNDDTATGQFYFTETVPYVVRRDVELETRLLQYGAAFWESFVLTGKPPPVASAQNRRVFSRLAKGWFGK